MKQMNKKTTYAAGPGSTNTSFDDPQHPKCNVEGHNIHKNLYCADCADKTTIIYKKEDDPNFVCMLCNDQRDSAHCRHWTQTSVGYMTEKLMLTAPRYKEKESIQEKMAKLMKSTLAVFKPRLEII
jgi:hypothetical protein